MRFAKILLFSLTTALLTPAVRSQDPTPISPAMMTDVLRRLEATERRLQQTERQLHATQGELQQLKQQGQPSVHPASQQSFSNSNQPPSAYFGSTPQHQAPVDDPLPNVPQEEATGLSNFCGNCIENIGWNKEGGWRVVPFGKLELETVLATDSAVADNYIVFANPRQATKTERIDVTGQSSQIGLNIGGPMIGNFEVGGLILMDFHGNRPSRNEPGAYFIRAYAELANENWRIAFGQMGDTIGGWNGETVNWSGFGGLGFLGANQRGTFRVDRYLNPSEDVQWTLTGALTQPVVTDLAGFQDALGQDNGLPNLESQVLLALGPETDGERPLQMSLSTMFGEYFAAASNLPGFPQGITNTSRSYAISGAMQWTGDRYGMRGQLWNGRGLGTYMGAVSQALNTETGETIRATGGFAQVWVNLSERVKLSTFLGIDDPLNGDLSITDNQRAQNRLIGGNIFVNFTDNFHVGMDLWNVRTDYSQAANRNELYVLLTEATLTY